METVTLTIDGRPITVEKGKTVLQASIEAGITVPYYCYHPGLGIDGSCRVCIVKIEKMPKLQTACSTTCTDGMVVSTRDPETTAARAGVFEFLLVNHPLDCPVCDKGGECPLQDFSYTFGPAESRMDFPRRTFDGEGVRADVDFGPTLLLNRNRCILCTRCVRFMKEIGGDAQIGIVDRGNGSEIATFREEGVHSLLSGNLMDVCPVGAITTREYRFKSRPWDNPGVTDTICTMCSKGCNTSAWQKAKPEWARGSRLIRMTPRFNPDVNSYWMCDIGRFKYHWVEGETRLRKPLLAPSRDASAPAAGVSRLEPASWHEVEARLRDVVQQAGAADPSSVRFLASAHASIEELFVLKSLAEGLMGADGLKAISVSWSRSAKPQPADVKFVVPEVDAPNVNGARDLGFAVGAGTDGAPDLEGLRTDIASGRVRVVYVLDPGPDGSIGDVEWLIAARRAGTLATLIVQGVVMSELAAAADIVLPGSAWVEKDGHYTNDKGYVQASSQAVAAPGEAREDWEILANLGRLLGLSLGFATAQQLRSAIEQAMPGSPYASIAGTVFARSIPASNWLQASNPSERWKWDFMYQDLPPVKGHNVQMEGQKPGDGFIPLKPV
jgi:NADH-quinone oxidoreductase subunit G